MDLSESLEGVRWCGLCAANLPPSDTFQTPYPCSADSFTTNGKYSRGIIWPESPGVSVGVSVRGGGPVGVLLGVSVGVPVMVGVPVGVGESVAVLVGVSVDVSLAMGEAVGLAVSVGV